MVYQLNIRLEGATLDQIREELKKGAKIPLYARHIGQRLARTIRPLVERTPKKTGALRKGWASGFKKTGPLRFELENPLPYAAPIEFGSRPHIIRPKRAKVLVFMSGKGKKIIRRSSKLTGKALKKPQVETLVFTRKVNHPGNRPFGMLKNTLPEMERAVDDGLLAGLKESFG